MAGRLTARGQGMVGRMTALWAALTIGIALASVRSLALALPTGVSRAFAGDVETAMKDAKPLMKFLCEALGAPI